MIFDVDIVLMVCFQHQESVVPEHCLRRMCMNMSQRWTSGTTPSILIPYSHGLKIVLQVNNRPCLWQPQTLNSLLPPFEAQHPMQVARPPQSVIPLPLKANVQVPILLWKVSLSTWVISVSLLPPILPCCLKS